MITLRYRDVVGKCKILRLDDKAGRELAGIELSMRAEPLDDGAVVHGVVKNRSDQPIRLDDVRFEIATGLRADSPARFFKHGYQSWSNSYPAQVGRREDSSGRPLLARISHQSEVERPQDLPEAATSELFTVIESNGSPQRFAAGFIGASSQFCNLTVLTPDAVIARALFDGVWLQPGDSRDIEPLAYWRSVEDAALMAARWAGLMGHRMQARTKARYQRGWCSWYQYFDAITEDSLRSNLTRLKQLRSDLTIDVVQLDDGFQAALGDWDRTNAKFPSGLRVLADEIRDASFTPGLWTAPFLASRDSSVMRDHPGWFIRDQDGIPVRVVNNPSWTTGEDKFAYALDPSHPECRHHLEQLFCKLVHEFGYGYLKLDFLFAAAAPGHHHREDLTRAEVLRSGLETIRHAAGDSTFILGCGCPLGPAVGILDGMRIGPDVAPYWGGDVEPGTRLALNAIVARSFMHRRLWLNDPDCLMLRDSQTQLNSEERYALAALIAVSGGMLLFSDDLTLLGDDGRKLYHQVMELGLEVDDASRSQPPLASDLMLDGDVKRLRVETRRGTVQLYFNPGDIPRIIAWADELPTGVAQLIHPDGETELRNEFVLPPHSCRILRQN